MPAIYSKQILESMRVKTGNATKSEPAFLQVKAVSETPDTNTRSRPDSADSPYLCGIERVTDGARTRDLRSHKWVVGA